MNDVSELIDLIDKKTNLVAMLAPSFPINYEYPQIITRLRKLGFNYVVEVSAGARKTNEEILEVLKNNPTSRFITSPCPSFVRLVRTKFPNLVKYLASAADSPMIATARIIKEKYPDSKPVFIGPCITKKLESSQDYPDLNILVINYNELEQAFAHYNISEISDGTNDKFDIEESSTRIYPFDGGLTMSAGIDKILKPEEIRILSGWKNCQKLLEEFESNPTIRFVDILFCEGGCINGPAANKQLSVDQRKQKILEYAKLTR